MVKWLCWGHFPHVKFHCGPACPSERCPGYQRDNISHPGVQTSIPRRHVIHVLPKKNSSFLCANQNFENDLKEWQVQGWLTDVQLVHVYSACYLEWGVMLGTFQVFVFKHLNLSLFLNCLLQFYHIFNFTLLWKWLQLNLLAACSSK